MIEQGLEKIKDNYQNTELPQYLIYNGWADLKFKLPVQNNKFWKIYLVRGLIFTTICILITTSLVSASKAAKPGDVLFPVKKLTEDIKATFTGNYQEKIESRAQDVIDLSKKSQFKLEKAIEEYQQTAKDGLKNTKDSDKYDQLNKTIEQHNEEIKNIETEDSKSINNSPNKNGEIKGQNSSDDKEHNSNNSENLKRQNSNTEHYENTNNSEKKSD